MATDDQEPVDREQLNREMDALAREIVGLKPDDPRPPHRIFSSRLKASMPSAAVVTA